MTENHHHISLKPSGESWSVIIMVLLGWTSYSMADVSVKLLSADYSIWQIMNTASGTSMVLLGLWLGFKYGIKGFIPEKIGWTALRTLIVTCLALSIVNAFARVPLADVYGITFAAPFLTLILVALFLKEHVGWQRWATVVVGFIGVLIMAGPQFKELNAGYLLALGAMIFIGLISFTLRKVGKSDPPALYGFYPIVSIFLVTTPLALPVYVMPESGDLWKFALQIGGIMGGQIFVSYATATARETASIAPFVYIQIIWGVIFGYFVFGDILKPEALIGMPLIIGAGLYMIYRERQLRKKV